MKKSELKQLISEVIAEYDDPYVKMEPSTHRLDPPLKQTVVRAADGLHKLHAALKKAAVEVYGQKFRDIEVYMSVGSDGKPDIQIHGSSLSDKPGGGLDVRYQSNKM